MAPLISGMQTLIGLACITAFAIMATFIITAFFVHLAKQIWEALSGLF
jgi:hypothetical protein